MKHKSLAVLGVVLGTVIMGGCAGGGTAPVDRPVGQATSSNTQPGPGQESPSSPSPQNAAPTSQINLTSRLLSLPPNQAQPAFRWPQQPKGTQYRPLPSGILLVWPNASAAGSSSVQFSVSALKSDGQPLWTYRLQGPASEVQYVDVSPSGDRVAFVEPDGNVHVLSTSDGKIVATVHVELENPDADSVHLIADGQFLAVKSRTRSGVVPWTVAVYPVATNPKIAYGTEGMEVQLSPYHDMVLALQAVDKQGIKVTTAAGTLGFIPYEYQAQAEQVKLASSADGQLIYIVSRNKGLDVFDRDLKHQFHLEASPSLEAELAPVSKVIWHDTTPGVTDLIDANGKVTTFTTDQTKITSGRVMPGGEKVFRVGGVNQKVDCVVKINGDVFGCSPFVNFSSATVDGRTFFWARLQDGTIAAYKP